MAKEYITNQELYKRLGISGTMGRKAEKAGRLVCELVQGKWLYEWEHNKTLFINSSRDPFRYTPDKVRSRNLEREKANVKMKIKYPKNKRYKKRVNSLVVMEEEDERGNHPIDLIEDPIDPDGDFTQGMSKVQAESVKQVYLAKRAKVAFLKEVGTLVELQRIVEEGKTIALKVQKSILSIPDRVAGLYASMTDAKEIRENLLTELRYALSNLDGLDRVIKEQGIKNDNIEEETEEESEE